MSTTPSLLSATKGVSGNGSAAAASSAAIFGESAIFFRTELQRVTITRRMGGCAKEYCLSALMRDYSP